MLLEKERLKLKIRFPMVTHSLIRPHVDNHRIVLGPQDGRWHPLARLWDLWPDVALWEERLGFPAIRSSHATTLPMAQ